MRRKMFPFYLLICGFIFSGCLHLSTDYDVSLPIESENLKMAKYKAGYFNYNLVVLPEISHFKLSVKPFNARSHVGRFAPILTGNSDEKISAPFRTGKKFPSSPFIIEIVIIPEIEGFMFQPYKVSLIMKDGNRILPLGWASSSGMGEITTVQYPYQSEFNLCHRLPPSALRPVPKFDQKLINRFEGTFRIPTIRYFTDFMCFWLIFDIPPLPPEEKFSVLIEGIERNGHLLSIPAIRFKKGLAKYFESAW